MVMIFVATTKGRPVPQLAGDAEAVGNLIAELGCDLLTGGGPGAMEIVARAFCKASFRCGRSVGVLPGSSDGLNEQRFGTVSDLLIIPKAEYPNSWIELPIHTHLDGKDLKRDTRNPINVASGDAVVILSGGEGTQAELELALALKRPTIVFLRERQRIGNYKLRSLPPGAAVVDDLDALRDALRSTIAPLAMPRPTFTKLRQNYTTDPGNIHQCTMQFPNTCAIRMSEALVKTNSDFLNKFAHSSVNRCPHNYIRGAQDLASVLRKADVFGMQDAGFEHPGSSPAEISGKKGVVAYMRIPGYDGQGHIDLWDGSAPVGDSYWSAETIWFWKLT